MGQKTSPFHYLSSTLQNNLKELQISEFSSIQKSIIPFLLESKDVSHCLGIAETGSGKTFSYLIPLIEKIYGTPKKPLKALIILPTKELVDQVYNEFKKISKNSNLYAIKIYGEKSFSIEKTKLNQGIHIAIGTPGRLMDHFRRESLDLNNLDYFILDEMDQLLDSGVINRLTPIIEQMNTQLASTHHWFFSATSTPNIDQFLKNYFGKFTLKKFDFSGNQVKKSISHSLTVVPKNLHYEFLKFLIKAEKIQTAIIFVRTKDDAMSLGELLKEDQYKANYLMSDLSKHQRAKVLRDFKNKSLRFLVATDIAARGLDIVHVNHVINIELPLVPVQYIHRLGRTARFLNSGRAITIVSSQSKLYSPGQEILEKEFHRLGLIENELGEKIPQVHYDQFLKKKSSNK